jgi:hypothetical protein
MPAQDSPRAHSGIAGRSPLSHLVAYKILQTDRLWIWPGFRVAVHHLHLCRYREGAVTDLGSELGNPKLDGLGLTVLLSNASQLT